MFTLLKNRTYYPISVCWSMEIWLSGKWSYWWLLVNHWIITCTAKTNQFICLRTLLLFLLSIAWPGSLWLLHMCVQPKRSRLVFSRSTLLWSYHYGNWPDRHQLVFLLSPTQIDCLLFSPTPHLVKHYLMFVHLWSSLWVAPFPCVTTTTPPTEVTQKLVEWE